MNNQENEIQEFKAYSRCCGEEMNSRDIRIKVCPMCEEYCSIEYEPVEKEISQEQDDWLNPNPDLTNQLKLDL